MEYGRTLRPGVLDRYRAAGYCTVMTIELIRGRADAAGDRGALAYYDRAGARVRRDLRGQPVPGRTPSRRAFSFDLSYSYYSPAYERPGPATSGSTGSTTARRATARRRA